MQLLKEICVHLFLVGALDVELEGEDDVDSRFVEVLLGQELFERLELDLLRSVALEAVEALAKEVRLVLFDADACDCLFELEKLAAVLEGLDHAPLQTSLGELPTLHRILVCSLDRVEVLLLEFQNIFLCRLRFRIAGIAAEVE